MLDSLKTRFADRWLWLCPVLSILLAAAVLMFFGFTFWGGCWQGSCWSARPRSFGVPSNSGSTNAASVRPEIGNALRLRRSRI